jgi:epoxyqueuosine reductase QueG
MNQIEAIIQSVLRSPENRLAPEGTEPAWDDFLVGVARADDPIWESIASHIGPFYWRPLEAFNQAFPGLVADAAQLRVIAWILPQTKATRQDHRKQKDLPSLRWTLARHYGEMVNQLIRGKVAEELTASGHPAVAPVNLPGWDYRQSESVGICSNWSERHAAFVAGLGTFGLSDGLITPKGKAMRVGSVIAKIDVPATPRSYGDNHRAYCLFFRKGVCAVCAKRCPAKAISPAGHDKAACMAYIRGVTSPYVAEELLGFPVNSCGLCQTGVPCESRVPPAK